MSARVSLKRPSVFGRMLLVLGLCCGLWVVMPQEAVAKTCSDGLECKGKCGSEQTFIPGCMAALGILVTARDAMDVDLNGPGGLIDVRDAAKKKLDGYKAELLVLDAELVTIKKALKALTDERDEKRDQWDILARRWKDAEWADGTKLGIGSDEIICDNDPSDQGSGAHDPDELITLSELRKKQADDAADNALVSNCELIALGNDIQQLLDQANCVESAAKGACTSIEEPNKDAVVNACKEDVSTGGGVECGSSS